MTLSASNGAPEDAASAARPAGTPGRSFEPNPSTDQAPVHAPVRPGWLARDTHAPVPIGVPVIDAHHHLWDRPGSRYLLAEYAEDAASVPELVGSIYAQCRSRYTADAEPDFRPVGEVEFAREIAEEAARTGLPAICRGIIGGADLTLDPGRMREVLAAMQQQGGGRLVGVRNQTAWHADPLIRSAPVGVPGGKLADPRFLRGADVLGSLDLTLDVWAYQSQLDDVIALATHCPETRVVVNHFGGPLGVRAYRDDTESAFRQWADALRRLAELPNTHLKLSGFGLRVFGRDFDRADAPPSPAELARAMAPYYRVATDAFGAERLMFGSNFPVDKGMFSFRSLWSAFALLSADASRAEREHLFATSAAAVYRLTHSL